MAAGAAALKAAEAEFAQASLALVSGVEGAQEALDAADRAVEQAKQRIRLLEGAAAGRRELAAQLARRAADDAFTIKGKTVAKLQAASIKLARDLSRNLQAVAEGHAELCKQRHQMALLLNTLPRASSVGFPLGLAPGVGLVENELTELVLLELRRLGSPIGGRENAFSTDHRQPGLVEVLDRSAGHCLKPWPELAPVLAAREASTPVASPSPVPVPEIAAAPAEPLPAEPSRMSAMLHPPKRPVGRPRKVTQRVSEAGFEMPGDPDVEDAP